MVDMNSKASPDNQLSSVKANIYSYNVNRIMKKDDEQYFLRDISFLLENID